MKLSQAIKMACSAILSNKLRSFLTMLGIIIGVMAVTLLISLVQGATNTVTDSLNDLGGNNLVVSIANQEKKLTLSEVQGFSSEDEIVYVSPTVSGNGTAKAYGNAVDVSITGITSSYEIVQGLDLVAGRGITDLDNEYRLAVCVIGSSVAENLFGNRNALQETLRLSGKDYRVVGLLEDHEQSVMEDENNSVYIPIANAQRLLSTVTITSFYVTGNEEFDMEEVKASLNERLRAKFGDENDYRIMSMADVLDIIDSVIGTLELLLGAIASISLVVGGIGIMNIMLVSVSERTREIGIRKAIGAQKADIIVQFMIEAVLLSVAGGLMGMMLSQGLLSFVNVLFPAYHFAISGSVAAIALGFSILVGMVFGIYPANKAACLKPINALRYE